MSFTIKCNVCNREQVLDKDKFYNTEKISIKVDLWTTTQWNSLSIQCKNKECNNSI